MFSLKSFFTPFFARHLRVNLEFPDGDLGAQRRLGIRLA
jgi:hypothetical protein